MVLHVCDQVQPVVGLPYTPPAGGMRATWVWLGADALATAMECMS